MPATKDTKASQDTKKSPKKIGFVFVFFVFFAYFVADRLAGKPLSLARVETTKGGLGDQAHLCSIFGLRVGPCRDRLGRWSVRRSAEQRAASRRAKLLGLQAADPGAPSRGFGSLPASDRSFPRGCPPGKKPASGAARGSPHVAAPGLPGSDRITAQPG